MNTLTAYQIFIGAENNSPNGTFSGRALVVLNNTLTRYFKDGYTVCDGKGSWTDNKTDPKSPVVYWQHCKVITVFVNDEVEGSIVDSFIRQIKNELKQLAVAKVKIGAAEFI